MASLLAKDAYLQGLARRICAQPSPEPQRRKSAGKTQGSETARPPKKKRKRPQKKSREREEKAAEPRAQTLGEKSLAASRAGKPAAAKDEEASGSTGGPTGGLAAEPDSLFALDVLRQRLHEKIQEARGQVGGGDLGVPERRLLRWLSRSARRLPALPAIVGLASVSTAPAAALRSVPELAQGREAALERGLELVLALASPSLCLEWVLEQFLALELAIKQPLPPKLLVVAVIELLLASTSELGLQWQLVAALEGAQALARDTC
ncbi:surfeit locus protein 6 [Pteropus vampyrus]|uniref:Surfeit locus protein 6 n=1 Tax=Pteropus vampyrus TaxID=132908 RepID=A0A6P3QY43_PTEVA|nr:surfeit locus protein 6 [Pteropus vampyrus]